jgi:triacylglycerol lipase
MVRLIVSKLMKSIYFNLLKNIYLSNGQGRMMLLHGMCRSDVTMQSIERFFLIHGYQVSNISYPSTKYGIESLFEDYLQSAIQKAQ